MGSIVLGRIEKGLELFLGLGWDATCVYVVQN
jgi:hypothetical protein